MLSDRKTVSIIIPCYNGEPFLGEALRSACAQTVPALEVIVIDDGSTDRSAQLAQGFGPPVRVLRQPNQGESTARNTGIDAARGDYVLFLDADDLLDPRSLEVQLAHLRRAPHGVACMGCARFREDLKKPHFIQHAAAAFFPAIIRGNINPIHAWLAPKNVVVAAGKFRTSMAYFEDWDLWWRVGLTGAPLVPVDFVGAYYRQHRASQLATATAADRALAHAQLMQHLAAALLQRPDMLELHGEELFWSCCVATERACRQHVPWSDLAAMRQCIEQLAQAGPRAVKRSRYARLVRLLGLRWANRARSMADRFRTADDARTALSTSLDDL